MTDRNRDGASQGHQWDVLTHKNVLSGLMFFGVGVFGLIVSRNYDVGTTLNMGTGYVPRLLCWILVILGAIIFAQGYLEYRASREAGTGILAGWRGLLFVTLSLVVFALTLETLGLVVAIALLIGIGAFGAPELRPLETIVAAAVLIFLSWAIFIFALSLPIRVWPW